ncbi:uncharacterized protein LOC141584312 [Saimiri boliviensis]|uniref:uncharacterized protein LOC141584312 n=1 Tax=Saimiri boliviensis TaxID=27679 RepID=UPI003D7818E3
MELALTKFRDDPRFYSLVWRKDLDMLSHISGFIVGALHLPCFQEIRKDSFAPLQTPTAATPVPSPPGSRPGEGYWKLVGRGLRPLPIGIAPRKPVRIGRREGPGRACGADWLLHGWTLFPVPRRAIMVTRELEAAPPLWPMEVRLAALLPDLLVFRKPRGSEPEVATAQGVLGVHVTDVLCFGGDILNITGNMLLALWRAEQNQLSDIITLVAKCSMEIQEKFGIYHTREGQDLQLKIGSTS